MVGLDSAGGHRRMNYTGLCRRILDVSLRVRRRERVWIDGWDHTTDLTSILAQESQKRGCEVFTTSKDEKAWTKSLRAGPSSSLKRPSRAQLALLNEVDSYVFALGPRRPIDWAGIPPERRKLATIWLLEQNDFVREWRSVSRRRRVKMVGIEATLATQERAAALGLSFLTWKRMMYEACLLDYHELSRTASRIVGRLKGNAQVRITAPGGTDLQLRLDRRPVEVSDGLATERTARDGGIVFLPPGAVGTTVQEGSVEGRISYDSPIRFPEGRAERLTLHLKSGRIEDFSAASGAGAAKSFLQKTKGDEDRFSFFGIGLNPKLRLGFTEDDRVFGSVELNFGANQSRGGKNRGDRNWWGTVKRSTIVVGSSRVMENGRLSV